MVIPLMMDQSMHMSKPGLLHSFHSVYPVSVLVIHVYLSFKLKYIGQAMLTKSQLL